MGDDRGEWWRGITDNIRQKNGIAPSDLEAEKQQVINGVKLAVNAEEWGAASRLAKNVAIYNKLIELNKYIIEADAIRIAREMEPMLDEEFKDNGDQTKIREAILHHIPTLMDGGGKSRKRKSRKRKSRKRKSRKRKSRGRKTKRRNR